MGRPVPPPYGGPTYWDVYHAEAWSHPFQKISNFKFQTVSFILPGSLGLPPPSAEIPFGDEQCHEQEVKQGHVPKVHAQDIRLGGGIPRDSRGKPWQLVQTQEFAARHLRHLLQEFGGVLRPVEFAGVGFDEQGLFERRHGLVLFIEGGEMHDVHACDARGRVPR